MMRYGQRGERRGVLRDAAAETVREARRAASVYGHSPAQGAAGRYVHLAGCRYADGAALMLKPGERRRESVVANGAPSRAAFPVFGPQCGQPNQGNSRRGATPSARAASGLRGALRAE